MAPRVDRALLESKLEFLYPSLVDQQLNFAAPHGDVQCIVIDVTSAWATIEEYGDDNFDDEESGSDDDARQSYKIRPFLALKYYLSSNRGSPMVGGTCAYSSYMKNNNGSTPRSNTATAYKLSDVEYNTVRREACVVH